MVNMFSKFILQKNISFNGNYIPSSNGNYKLKYLYEYLFF